jgi:hypothetical protein
MILNEVNKYVEGDIVKTPDNEVGIVYRLSGHNVYVKLSDGSIAGPYDHNEVNMKEKDKKMENENVLIKIDSYLNKKQLNEDIENIIVNIFMKYVFSEQFEQEIHDKLIKEWEPDQITKMLNKLKNDIKESAKESIYDFTQG